MNRQAPHGDISSLTLNEYIDSCVDSIELDNDENNNQLELSCKTETYVGKDSSPEKDGEQAEIVQNNETLVKLDNETQTSNNETKTVIVS